MITFSKLEKKGNIGNQLFQIASVIGISKANDHDFAFPRWSFSSYFENELPVLKDDEFIYLVEKQYHYEEVSLDAENYDLEGWFQSEKYFCDASTKHYFTFKEETVLKVKQQFNTLFTKKTILISIRRGDFVDHPDYYQLPINFYLHSLAAHFPDWQERHILILSDDVNYCKFHFSSLENVFFTDSVSVIEQLILSSLCDDFIISNSTFSWWCAWFGEKAHSKVIRPLHNFSDEKRKTFDDKDYFPERWIAHDFKDKKIDLGQTTLIMQSRDLVIEDYFKYTFDFINAADFNLSNAVIADVGNFIYLNNCIPSPVVFFQIVTQKKDTVFYLRGNFLSISRILDVSTFIRQFDFGIFARLVGKKSFLNKKELVLISVFSDSGKKQFMSLKSSSFKNIKDFVVNYCLAGRIIPFFEFRFYIATTFDKFSRILKKKIKKLIKYKPK